MQAQVAELKDVKADPAKFEECAKKAHELVAEGETLRVKMDAEMDALKVCILLRAVLEVRVCCVLCGCLAPTLRRWGLHT